MEAATAAPEPSAAPPPAAEAPREPQRRQLTVMFVDLVVDRAVGEARSRGHARGDPRVQKTAAGSRLFEGHVAKLMGDGVLAYSGWPRANEDEAERAIRAGLPISRPWRPLCSRRRSGGARRHRHGARGGRRSGGRGLRAGAGGGRRDTEPRGTAAAAGRAGLRPHQPGDAPADRRPVRPGRSGPQAAERVRRADPRLFGFRAPASPKAASTRSRGSA